MKKKQRRRPAEHIMCISEPFSAEVLGAVGLNGSFTAVWTHATVEQAHFFPGGGHSRSSTRHQNLLVDEKQKCSPTTIPCPKHVGTHNAPQE